MRAVQINSVCGYGSTGKICVGISRALNLQNIENYILYCSGNSTYSQGIKCTEKFPKLQALRSRILGNYGFNSEATTKRLLVELDRIAPDVVHLHNLHGHNCNLDMLMDYCREQKIKLVWTFHDCWAFTAYCPHFMRENCEKWKTGCNHCVQRKRYSWFLDRSTWLYQKKKEAFSNLDMTIITPSHWLADLVSTSFLREYPVQVINNGIDLNIFQPRQSDFRRNYHITESKFILLGVAIHWGTGKGVDVFIRLARQLDTEKFQIVLVGTDSEIDKQLPKNVISIHRTENQRELAEIYSAADLFVNPTREDTYPTVNLEAMACGTPILTFRTGGSPECIDEKTGWVVDCDDEEALYCAILAIEAGKPFSAQACCIKAQSFSEEKKYQEYVELYRNLVK